MARGRPRKNQHTDDQSEPPNKKDAKDKKQQNQFKTHDGHVVKPAAKKRGRKKGKVNKNEEIMMKPCDVIDYMIRNYPRMDIQKIKNDVLAGLELKSKLEDDLCILDHFIYNDEAYFYDKYDTIFNCDGKIMGFFFRYNDEKKIYLFELVFGEKISYRDIIEEIESVTYE